MRLSRASTYAIHGVCYVAGQASGRLVPLSEIHRKCRLPEKHLAKIFQTLVHSGYLRSVRGVHGGFALARPADSINALEIIRTVDGARKEKCPFHKKAPGDSGCCPPQQLIRSGQQAMERVLQEASLAQLARSSPPPLG
jgi:Rrf2 family protein